MHGPLKTLRGSHLPAGYIVDASGLFVCYYSTIKIFGVISSSGQNK